MRIVFLTKGILSFMYSNVYGVDGVTKLIQMMKAELLQDAAQIGITDFHNISSKMVSILHRLVMQVVN